jgi:hypothetical protein
MMRYFIPILLLLLLFSPAAAQEESPFPVLNAEEIFAEGVTVLERLPVIEFDSENHLLYYFNPEAMEWSSYPYPNEVVRFNRFEERNDGTYILQRGNDDNGRLTSYEDEWLFNPQTEIINRENLHCGRIAALPNEGEWFIHQLESGIYILCDSETGQQITLSDSIQSELDCGNYPESSHQSPNREWLIFFDCNEPLGIYSANTITNEIHYLGEINETYFPYFYWLTNEVVRITVYYDRAMPPLVNVFLANAAQGQSLLYIEYNPDIDIDRPFIAWHEQSRTNENSFQNKIYLLNIASYEQETIYEETCEIAHQENCFMGGQVAISPSLRYLAIAPTNQPFGEPLGNERFFVVDRETNEIIYNFSHEEFWRISDMHWLDDSRLVFVDEAEMRTHIMLLDLSNQAQIHGLASESFNIGLRLSPNDNAIILQHEENSDVLHFGTMQTFMVLLPNINGYFYWDNFSDNLTLIAKVNPPCQQFPCFGGAWRIRIDALAEEQS